MADSRSWRTFCVRHVAWRLAWLGLAAICLATLLVSPVRGQGAPLPPRRERISDLAGVISPEWKARIWQLMQVVQERTGVVMVVVTVPSLQGESIEDYSERLFRKWGIGKKGQDNGLLLVAAIQDRKVRIEVGYGLEPAITDSVAGEIIRNEIAPRFRQQDYGAGIYAALQRLAERIAAAKNVTLPELPGGPPPAAAPEGGGGAGVGFGLVVLLLLFVVVAGVLQARRSRFPSRCPRCGHPVERIERVIRPPGFLRNGITEVGYRCPHCGYQHTERVSTRNQGWPIIIDGGGWGSGSSSGGDWSSSGGGWSGDGGGFDGGSSGGGGASGSW